MHLSVYQLHIVSKCLAQSLRYVELITLFLAALVLIMLAIGAVHLSENDFARSAYEASCLVLAQVVHLRIYTK